MQQEWFENKLVVKPGTADEREIVARIGLWPKQTMFLRTPKRYVLFGGARGPGKCPDVNTPVPTPDGWATIGSLRVGDRVFDERGVPCTVTGKSPVYTDHKCYRLVFDDGSEIVADAEHLWHTFTKADREALRKRSDHYRARRRASRPSRAKAGTSVARTEALASHNAAVGVAARKPAPTGAVRTTEEIAGSLRVQHGREVNHSIRVSGPWDLPERDLPVDPYVLGAWLGDGTKHHGIIASNDPEVIQEVEAAGYKASKHKAPFLWGIRGLVTDLRAAGVHLNKHIPDEYLRASAEQRLALLQGLMDTDGSCSSRDGSCEFTNTNERLAHGVHELVISLGYKARLTTGRATFDGRDCGPKWRIVWTPNANLPAPFRLSRKKALLRSVTRQTAEFRYIVSCEEVESVPVQCISVDSPSHLYLIGRSAIPTHNTVALITAAQSKMLAWPGIRGLYLRKDLKDLKGTALVEMLAKWPKELYDPKYGGQHHKGENWFRFPNGSVLQLGELKDWESYKSATVGFVIIDEANEVEEEAFLNLDPTLRWIPDWSSKVCERPECKELGEDFAREHKEHPFYQVLMASNPAPGWLKTRFWEPWRDGQELPNHAFIPATAYDNPSLPPDFIPRLMENHTATWVQNFIHGDWSSFENMAWPAFSRAVHCWRGAVPFAEIEYIEGGIDWGGTTEEAHRTCAYLTAWLRDGRYLTFWEYSKQGGASTDLFAEIGLKTRQFKVRRWWADASQNRANELLRNNGVPVVDAPRYKGAVKDGLNLVHRMMVDTPAQFSGGRTGPQWYVVEDACPRLISGIETYKIDPATGEPERNQEDDEVNAFRYNVMGITGKELTPKDRASVDYSVQSPAGVVRAQKPSGMLQRVKDERRERYREMLEKVRG